MNRKEILLIWLDVLRNRCFEDYPSTVSVREEVEGKLSSDFEKDQAEDVGHVFDWEMLSEILHNDFPLNRDDAAHTVGAARVSQINLLPDHLDLLMKWCSISRTINNAICCIEELLPEGPIDDNAQTAIDELTDLRAPLDALVSQFKEVTNRIKRNTERVER